MICLLCIINSVWFDKFHLVLFVGSLWLFRCGHPRGIVRWMNCPWLSFFLGNFMCVYFSIFRASNIIITLWKERLWVLFVKYFYLDSKIKINIWNIKFIWWLKFHTRVRLGNPCKSLFSWSPTIFENLTFIISNYFFLVFKNSSLKKACSSLRLKYWNSISVWIWRCYQCHVISKIFPLH